LVHDTGLLWDEALRARHQVDGLSTGDLLPRDDWLERSPEERQRYIHAQLAVDAGRIYADSGWQTLEHALDKASAIQRNLVAQEKARRAREVLEQTLQKEPAERQVAASETRLKDLEKRRAEIRHDDSGTTPDEVAQEELRDLELRIEVAQGLLRQDKILFSLVDSPKIDQLLHDATLELMQKLDKELDPVRKSRAASAARQRNRRFLSWASIITVAIALFVLGKLSDLFYWWLALIAAAALWAVSEFVARPFLRRIAAKGMSDGLIHDINTVWEAKSNIRALQAIYNQDLRKAGMDEVQLIPVVNSSSEEIQPPKYA
jgi:hypothetical protein